MTDNSVSAELDAHYATYPIDISAEWNELDTLNAAHPDWLPYRKKAAIYEIAARRCPVKVFRLYPFYFEMASGRERASWGFQGLGSWLLSNPANRELAQGRESFLAPAGEVGLCFSSPVIDLDHHCVGYDNVLRYGLNGLIAKAQSRLEQTASERERSFLESCIIANRALIDIAERFADEAVRLLAWEKAPDERSNLERIARTARRIPAEPPVTFYEALNTILFMREMCASLEGLGISTFGHLDRMLQPYLQADLMAGQITMAEAEHLLAMFLILTDVKFEMADQPRETSTTIVTGGCDAEGIPVFNDVTRMIIKIYRQEHLTNPKLNVRTSAGHPKAFFQLLGELIAEGTNVTAIYNDDVVIAANVKAGKALKDARLYVGGGCQENLLQNTEINSRCSIYINLPQTFNLGFFPEDERWSFLQTQYGLFLESYAGCANFSELYARCFRNLEKVFDFFITCRNETEKEGWRYNPSPLLSSTIDDCIQNGKDMMEGGCRYSYGSVSPIGVGTLIDSLFAIQEVVFNEARLTLDEFASILSSNFANHEMLRQYLINRVPKYGQENARMRAFSAKVFADLARISSGKPNGRGGKYEAGLMVYRLFTAMGKITDATPDGRRVGEFFSQGMSPSLLSEDGDGNIGRLLDAVSALDLSDFANIGVLDGNLPWTPSSYSANVVAAVLQRFLECGGSVLQLNVLDQGLLLEAQQHPEKHQDLTVRVCGYSARFVTLDKIIQDEIIQRALLIPQ